MIRANNAHGGHLDAGEFHISLPAYLYGSVGLLIAQSSERWGGYLSMTLDRPRKPRTTGPKSQNAHLRGHEQTIAEFTGYALWEVHDIVKANTKGWPQHPVSLGALSKMEYASEADIDTVVCAEAIETCHKIAHEIGCTLIEEEA